MDYTPYDDTFTQTNQPGSTWSYQSPTWAPSNTMSPIVRDSSPQGQTSRPHSIPELADRAKQILGDDQRPLNAWLRIAERAHRDAKSYQEQGDLESAFVEYAKAATILREKIPTHPDYMVLLSRRQRHNMSLVSHFYPMVHDCGPGSVGRVHIPYECIDEFIFRVLRDSHLV